MAKIARGLAIMAKNVPAPLETGDFGGGESGTKQGVRRTAGKYKTRKMKTLHLTIIL